MEQLDPAAKQWLTTVLSVPFTASKHSYAHQDTVYRIATRRRGYYLKIATTLKAERHNLKKLEALLHVPKVIDFHVADGNEYLLISELPGKNLAELAGAWSKPDIVDTFAAAIKQLHSVNVAGIFPEAGPQDVLLHGDMALPNIIVSEQGRIGYIDLGQLAYGSPELDLTDALWSLQRNIGPGYGALFLQKYGPVAMTPGIEKALKFRYRPPKPNHAAK